MAVLVLALAACGSTETPTDHGEGPCPFMLSAVESLIATNAAGVYQSADAAVEADIEADHEAIGVMIDFLEILEGPVSPAVHDAAIRLGDDMVEALAQDTDAMKAARRHAADYALAAGRATVALGDQYLDTCRDVPGHPPEDLDDFLADLRASLAALDAGQN